MMRVAVIDDEPLAREGVVARLQAHADVQLVGQYSDCANAAAGLAHDKPDLVFIDVQMPGVTGIDWLASLPVAERPMAVMLTAYDAYAVQAFALQAIDYLLKPVDDQRFSEALDRARQALPFRRQAIGLEMDDHAPLARIAVRIGTRNVLINTSDIDWIEADGDYAALHVAESVFLLRQSLHKLLPQLDKKQFIRIHRSTIVSIGRVAEWKMLPSKDMLLRLSTGTPLRVSRTYAGPLLAALEQG